MKALISPNDVITVSWITSWKKEDGKWVPETIETIYDCHRIAEVEQESFPVAAPMHWIDCPDNCKADLWYYKDGQVNPRPPCVPEPEENQPEENQPEENQGE